MGCVHVCRKYTGSKWAHSDSYIIRYVCSCEIGLVCVSWILQNDDGWIVLVDGHWQLWCLLSGYYRVQSVLSFLQNQICIEGYYNPNIFELFERIYNCTFFHFIKEINLSTVIIIIILWNVCGLGQRPLRVHCNLCNIFFVHPQIVLVHHDKVFILGSWHDKQPALLAQAYIIPPPNCPRFYRPLSYCWVLEWWFGSLTALSGGMISCPTNVVKFFQTEHGHVNNLNPNVAQLWCAPVSPFPPTEHKWCSLFSLLCTNVSFPPTKHLYLISPSCPPNVLHLPILSTIFPLLYTNVSPFSLLSIKGLNFPPLSTSVFHFSLSTNVFPSLHWAPRFSLHPTKHQGPPFPPTKHRCSSHPPLSTSVSLLPPVTS